MRNLAVAVLALKYLPTADTRQDAIQRFFTAAAANIMYAIEDPAGVCDAIQPDLDLAATRRSSIRLRRHHGTRTSWGLDPNDPRLRRASRFGAGMSGWFGQLVD